MLSSKKGWCGAKNICWVSKRPFLFLYPRRVFSAAAGASLGRPCTLAHTSLAGDHSLTWRLSRFQWKYWLFPSHRPQVQNSVYCLCTVGTEKSSSELWSLRCARKEQKTHWNPSQKTKCLGSVHHSNSWLNLSTTLSHAEPWFPSPTGEDEPCAPATYLTEPSWGSDDENVSAS